MKSKYFGQLKQLLQSAETATPIKAIPIGEFDSGSERTLAAWFRHASRTIPQGIVAEGLVTREQSTFKWGIARRKAN